MIKVDFTNALAESVFNKYLGRVKDIHQMIHNKTGLGNDFLGLVEWPNNYDQAELAKMKQTAKKLASEIDVLLVIAIGGSYLGTRAAIEMINGLYSQQRVEIIYIRNTMSSNYTAQVWNIFKKKNLEFALCLNQGQQLSQQLHFVFAKSF
ncbi:MAG: hypothetical protein OHM56_11340 [Spiroplasma phoeniceum]|nr:MAG: hypothetical protein OHM57_10760 [Spiroplasma phoeniceum]UZQ32142.1 MAG: hypothetical protein OHM56_11340 [Spiroplasma phoeniceum]